MKVRSACPGPFQDAVAAQVFEKVGHNARLKASEDVARRYNMKWDDVLDILRVFRRSPLWSLVRDAPG